MMPLDCRGISRRNNPIRSFPTQSAQIPHLNDIGAGILFGDNPEKAGILGGTFGRASGFFASALNNEIAKMGFLAARPFAFATLAGIKLLSRAMSYEFSSDEVKVTDTKSNPTCLEIEIEINN
ncbi:MAG: hypothetical protein V4489_01855, partial [Chlamydiota bacterium]